MHTHIYICTYKHTYIYILIEIAHTNVNPAKVRNTSFFEDEFNLKSNSEGDIHVFNFSRTNTVSRSKLTVDPIQGGK
jgi:hypothetical protein